MGRLIKLAIVLLLAESTMINCTVLARGTSSVATAFIANEIVPDVVPVAPESEVRVVYPSGVEVNFGNELTPTQVNDIPSVTWDAEPDSFYLLAFTDPDAPSRQDPVSREWLHWLVGNIPGNDIAAGETIFEYVGSGPPEGTGLHRYVFLVYQQPGNLSFNEPSPTDTSDDSRSEFSIANFATEYNLGDPIAGNFYQAQYEY